MATKDAMTQAQTLYVAYYGRPADAEGREFWANKIDQDGVDAVVDDFGASDEFNERFSELSSEELVQNLYQQVFGRAADDEGVTFYTERLDDDRLTLTEIASTIAGGAQNDDVIARDNKVAAANRYTEAAGEDHSGTAADNYAADFLSNVDAETDVDALDIDAVVADIPADTGTPSDLTEALSTLSSAEKSVDDFLKGLELDTNLDDKIDVEAGDATVSDVADTLDAAASAVNQLSNNVSVAGSVDADRTDAYNQAIIDENRQELNKTLDKAQGKVDSETGLQAKIDELQSTQATFKESVEAFDDAASDLTGELAKATKVNSDAITKGSLSGSLQFAGTSADSAASYSGFSVGDPVVTDSNGTSGVIDVIVVGENDTLEAASGIDASELKGFDALLDAAQAAYDEANGLSDATDAFESAIADAVNAEQDSSISASSASSFYNSTGEFSGLSASGSGAPLTSELLDAKDNLKDFNEAVSEYQAAKDTSDQLDALQEDVKDAKAAIEDSEEDGGMGIKLLGNGDSFTTNDDLYVFNAEDDADSTLTSFGTDGEDKIYFGDEFSFVELADGDSIGDNNGDADALEIFMEVDGKDLNLYVEDRATGGNASGTGDLTEVTLAGVGDDVDTANGFITADIA